MEFEYQKQSLPQGKAYVVVVKKVKTDTKYKK